MFLCAYTVGVAYLGGFLFRRELLALEEVNLFLRKVFACLERLVVIPRSERSRILRGGGSTLASSSLHLPARPL